MATDIERLEVLIEANTKAYENAMVKLQSQTAKALKSSENSVKGLDARLKTLQETVGKVGVIFGVAFGARELVEFVKNGIEAGAVIGEMAAKLGITTTAYQELTFVAGQAGANQDDVNAAFKGMIKVLGEAADGSKQAQDALAKLGITFDTIKGKSPDQVFTLILDRLSKIHDPLQRGAAELQVFGKSGLQLGEMAQLGAKGIDALKQKAHDVGVVLSDETIQSAKEAGDQLKLIGDVGSVAGIKLAADFKPAIDAIEKLITSPEFQAGLDKTASSLATIVETLVNHPDLLAILGGAAAGKFLGGLPGMAFGAGFGVGTSLGDSLFGKSTSDAQALSNQLSVVMQKMSDLQGIVAAGGVTLPGKGFVAYSGSQIDAINNQIAALEKQANDVNGKILAAPPAGHVGGGAGGAPPPAGGGWKPPPEVQAQTDAYNKLAVALQLQTTNLEASDREQFVANEVAKLGVKATADQKAGIEALAATLYDAKKAQADFNEATKAVTEDVGNTFISIIDGSATAGDALRGLAKQLEDMVLQATLLGEGPLAGIFGTASATSGAPGGILGAISALLARPK